MESKFEASWSFSDRACFFAAFDEFGVLLARSLPPSADGSSVRRQGEAVDERVERVPY